MVSTMTGMLGPFGTRGVRHDRIVSTPERLCPMCKRVQRLSGEERCAIHVKATTLAAGFFPLGEVARLLEIPVDPNFCNRLCVTSHLTNIPNYRTQPHCQIDLFHTTHYISGQRPL